MIRAIKKLIQSVTKGSPKPSRLTTIPRSEHKVSRRDISDAALKSLYRLHNAGYRACLVGGGVRDVLLGNKPKDFDIATSATPDEVKSLFRNCRLIGRRFRLAHLRYGREIIECATFRSHAPESSKTEFNNEGRILRDNTFGNIEEDALRRDFTVNALYYDIADYSILDYTSGMEDLKNKTLRLIGDPVTRYQEDPVRMLRAVRFACKLGFEIEQSAAEAIHQQGHLLAGIPSARLYDEVLKIFHSGYALPAYEMLREFGLFKHLFPALDQYLNADPAESMLDFIEQALVNTDQRIAEDKPVSPAFIFAALLWPLVHQKVIQLQSEKVGTLPALQIAGSEIFAQQIKTIAVPKRFSQISKNIWSMQPRFSNTRGKQPLRLVSHPNFRAAYDFFCIQSMVGLTTYQLCEWWTEFQIEHPPQRQIRRTGGHRPRRHRGPRKPDPA